MDLTSLRTQVRFKSNITDTSRLTNAEIDTELNNAQLLVAAKIVKINEDFFEEQKTTFDLKVNSSLYQLPTTLLKFKQLRLSYSTPDGQSSYAVATGYRPREIRDVSLQEESVSTANPIVDITNNYMRIKPTPTTAVADGGQIYFIRRPTTLAVSSDVSEIPTDYHPLLAIYGAARACEKFEIWDKADRFEGQFARGVKEMALELAQRELDYPLRFRDPKEGFGDTVSEIC